MNEPERKIGLRRCKKCKGEGIYKEVKYERRSCGPVKNRVKRRVVTLIQCPFCKGEGRIPDIGT